MHVLRPYASRSTLSFTSKFLLAAGLVAGSLAYTQAQAALPAMQHQGSVEYVSGGIGIDESTSFKDAMSQFPLALTFASSRQDPGAYAADVRVVIRDSHDAEVLNVTSQGPYLLARLPAGKYKISATYHGDTQTRSLDVGSKGTARAVFEWK